MQCGTKRVRSVQPRAARAAQSTAARRRLHLAVDAEDIKDCGTVDASLLFCDERLDASWLLCDERLHAVDAPAEPAEPAPAAPAPAELYVPTPSPSPHWHVPIFVPVPPAYSISEWPEPARWLSAAARTQLSAEHKAQVGRQLALLFPGCGSAAAGELQLGLQDTPFVAGLRMLFVFNLFGSGGRVDPVMLVVLMHSMILWTAVTGALRNFDVNLALSCWCIAGKFHHAKVMRRELMVCQLKFASVCNWSVVQDTPLRTIQQVRLLGGAVMTDEITVLSALRWNVRRRVCCEGILLDPLQEIASVMLDRPALAEHAFAELVFRELAFLLVDLNA